MPASQKSGEDLYDLDISLVSRVNRVSEARLNKYLTELQGKYDVIVRKLQKQIIETRRELELMQTERDKIAMKVVKKYNSRTTDEKEKVVSGGNLKKISASSTSTLASLPATSFASNFESASESLPLSNMSASVFESTLEPVYENAPTAPLVRPHTLGNPYKLYQNQNQPKFGRNSKKGFRRLLELNERNVSRMERSFGADHRSCDNRRSSEHGEGSTFVTEIWKKNRCLSRGHMPSKELSVERVYKLGERGVEPRPKPPQTAGYEIMTTIRPVRLEPLSDKHRLKSGSHLSVMTVI